MQSGETAVLGERVAQAGREGSVSRERCGELWGGCSPFIGAGGAAASRRAGDDDADKVGPAEIKRKRISELKIGFLNLPRLWRFVEGDLGGILTWGFFLNSSRLLKDFRKI
jgi:hypothetical protein